MALGLLLGAALVLTQAAAPSATPAKPPQDPGEVVVIGRPQTDAERRKAASEFVKQVSKPTARGRLARWEREEVCPGVIGQPEKHAAYIADRITMEAQAVGLRTGKAGCRANIFIIFSDRPNDTAAKFESEAHPRFFTPVNAAGDAEINDFSESLDDFLKTPRPVRSWHVAGKVYNTLATASYRTVAPWWEELKRVVIIVDTTQMTGVTYEALASYLTMSALAQLDPDPGATPLDSIAALFADREAGRPGPDTLTETDRAFLKGIYATQVDAKSLHAQQGSIRRSLLQTGAPAP